VITQPEFGERLRTRRLELGLSQKDLAGNSVTPSYISLLEHGSRVPSMDVVIRLAALLRTTPQDLVGGEIEGLVMEAPVPEARQSGLGSQLSLRRLEEYGDLGPAQTLLRERLETLRAVPGAEEEFLATGIQLLGVLRGRDKTVEWMRLMDELQRLPLVRSSADIRLLLACEQASDLREAGDLAQASRVCDEALADLKESGLEGSSEHVRLLGVITSVKCGLNEFPAAEAALQQMLAIAEENGHVGSLGRAHWVASMAYVRMNRLQEAYDELIKAHQSIDVGSMQVRDWLRFGRFTASILRENRRDLAAAVQWIDVAENTSKLAGLTSDLRSARRERALYELAAGNPATAEKVFTDLLDEEDPRDAESAVLYEGLGEALDHQGRQDEAIEWLRRAADLYEADANYRKAMETWRRIDRLRQPGS
jgi:transcriptional regulator with XRE-family HTH domain